MIRRFGLLAVVALLGVAVACGGGGTGEMESMDDGHDMAEMAPGPTTGDGAPMFEVDPFWPKPMPNNWLLGSTIGVAVDSRADNEFAAKSAAIAKGETDAFRVLLERLTLQRDHDRLPNLDRKSVSALLRDFSVDAEKFGGGRYIATLTVRFKAGAVRKLLGDADIPFAETTSRPVLILSLIHI